MKKHDTHIRTNVHYDNFLADVHIGTESLGLFGIIHQSLKYAKLDHTALFLKFHVGITS
jgi:hypothetical protein